MTTISPLAATYAPQTHRTQWRSVELAAHYGDPAGEYAAAHDRAIVVDRADRGIIELRGSDRAAFLHNLLTRSITDLPPGQSSRAFACNRTGRILFDLRVLALDDALWIDVDRSSLSDAVAHLDQHLFTEDVQIVDRSDDFARLDIHGPAAAEIAAIIGATSGAEPLLGAVAVLNNGTAHIIRTDALGRRGFMLVAARDAAPEWWRQITEAGAMPAGIETLNLLRIEAGVPWTGSELNEDFLPPETGLGDQAVSLNKGCYPGHEVLERMRSRDVVARRLVRLSLSDGRDLAPNPTLRQNGRDVGRITSLAPHVDGRQWVGLAYLAASADAADPFTAGPDDRPVHVDT